MTTGAFAYLAVLCLVFATWAAIMLYVFIATQHNRD